MQLCLKDWVLVDVSYWRSHRTYVKTYQCLYHTQLKLSPAICLPLRLLTTPSGQYLVNLCPRDLAWTWHSSGSGQYFPREIAFE